MFLDEAKMASLLSALLHKMPHGGWGWKWKTCWLMLPIFIPMFKYKKSNILRLFVLNLACIMVNYVRDQHKNTCRMTEMTAMRWKLLKSLKKKQTLWCMHVQTHTCTKACKYQSTFIFCVVQQFIHIQYSQDPCAGFTLYCLAFKDACGCG